MFPSSCFPYLPRGACLLHYTWEIVVICCSSIVRVSPGWCLPLVRIRQAVWALEISAEIPMVCHSACCCSGDAWLRVFIVESKLLRIFNKRQKHHHCAILILRQVSVLPLLHVVVFVLYEMTRFIPSSRWRVGQKARSVHLFWIGQLHCYHHAERGVSFFSLFFCVLFCFVFLFLFFFVWLFVCFVFGFVSVAVFDVYVFQVVYTQSKQCVGVHLGLQQLRSTGPRNDGQCQRS